MEMSQLEGGNHHHGDHRSFFFPPSIEPTPSTVLDCFVNVFVDPRPPESIRDQALHSLLSLVASIMVTAIYSSSPVCSRHYKTFYLFNVVLGLVLVVSRQGQLISISQYAPSLWSVLIRLELGLELSELPCPWLRFLFVKATPIHGSFNLWVLSLSFSPVCNMHLHT